ncbi:MAG TPA: hypothetical protein ENK43_15830 [Planctomycetes bacterium]|nr:hypothetical protein [Planctomycetota bacterium]
MTRGFSRLRLSAAALLCAGMLAASADAQLVGHAPNLGPRLTQAQVTSGALSLLDLRREGRRIFTTPFNKLDGHGEAYDPTNPDHTSFGNRPTLQNNGTFLRVNGLDAQTCLECHGIVSNSTIPATLGIGGVGGMNTSPMFMTRNIDVDDSANNGFAAFDGRLINPPFLFGAAGVEALGKEMTADLQALKMQAMLNPGTVIPLITKGVNFGFISYDGANFDTTGVVGIEPDLVVRPFGRKGENFTTRDFDRGAMQFHMGMQPVEIFDLQGLPTNTDGDGDGVVNELTIGEMSVLHLFANLQKKPEIIPQPGAFEGFITFMAMGCGDCHKPVLVTDSNDHNFSYPDVGTDPSANIYATVDLRQAPMNFLDMPGAGVAVFLFADLKRHDMGAGLMESFGSPLDAQFTTARLWGIADTAPYLHDGRATTLSEAILAHGGEALAARNSFAGLAPGQKLNVLAMLRSLRTPVSPNTNLGPPLLNVNN